MKRPSIPLALIALLLLASVALADASPDEPEATQSYEISKWTVACGGTASSSGGGYGLSGTIGQPDAGAASDGDYALSGGFWTWWGEYWEKYAVYLPLVLRRH